MHLEIAGFRLRPFKECYTIERFVPEHAIERGPRKGQVTDARWEPIECYPWTLERGLLMMLELIERHAEDGEAATIEEILQRWRILQAAVREALSSRSE